MEDDGTLEYLLVVVGITIYVSFVIQSIFFRIWLRYIKGYSYAKKNNFNQYSLPEKFRLVSFIIRCSGFGIFFGGCLGGMIWGVTYFLVGIIGMLLQINIETALSAEAFIVDYHFLIWLPTIVIFTVYTTIGYLFEKQAYYRNNKEDFDSGKSKPDLD